VPIVKKSPEEIEKMAEAGEILARCLTILREKARPGVTTDDLDEIAERFIRQHGAEPAFKGYRGFPGSICASPNSMIVHGIPGDYTLERGDILSIDVGVVHDGWVADAAVTVPVGPVSPIAHRLLDSTRAALFVGVDQCVAGNHLGDISHAIQQRVEQDGFSVVRSLVGHGIGRDMHEDPQIPNVGDPGTGPELAEGMVFAIEPMVNAGAEDVRMGADNWAVYARDGSLAAHFEHTVAITAEGPRILTPWHEQAALQAA
jgi:methionyl aminopeptidase